MRGAALPPRGDLTSPDRTTSLIFASTFHPGGMDTGRAVLVTGSLLVNEAPCRPLASVVSLAWLVDSQPHGRLGSRSSSNGGRRPGANRSRARFLSAAGDLGGDVDEDLVLVVVTKCRGH